MQVVLVERHVGGHAVKNNTCCITCAFSVFLPKKNPSLQATLHIDDINYAQQRCEILCTSEGKSPWIHW